MIEANAAATTDSSVDGPLALARSSTRVDGEALNLRQLGENRRFDVAEEVGQRRVGEHGFGPARPVRTARGSHGPAPRPPPRTRGWSCRCPAVRPPCRARTAADPRIAEIQRKESASAGEFEQPPDAMTRPPVDSKPRVYRSTSATGTGCRNYSQGEARATNREELKAAL